MSPNLREPWWTEVHDAVQLLVSQLNATVTHAAQVGVYTPPRGSPPPRRRRQPASLRHLAEVIRSHRLAPGVSADKDDVAALLSGDLRTVTNPALVVAVARAGHLIAGTPFDDGDADRLVVASAHVSALLDAAHQADERAARAVPTVVERPVVIDAYFTTRRPRRSWALIAAAFSAILLAGVAALLVVRGQEPEQQPPLPALAAPVTSAVTPLVHGHSSDDYLNARPLQDALDQGFTSVEADVVLRDGTLMLCHHVCADDRGAFEPAYLQALSARVQAGDGRVYPGYNQPFLLFVEITCVEAAGGGCTLPADPAAAAVDPNNPLVVAEKIMSALVPYRGMLQHVDATARRWGPVQVVLSGGHLNDQLPTAAGGHSSVRALLEQQPDRYAFLDGSFAVDRDQYNADLVPVISFQNPATSENCGNQGTDPIQTLHWDDIFHSQGTGHHVRVRDLLECPDRSGSWTDALYGGVDIIGTRHLPQFGGWLTDNAAGGGGGHCATPAWIDADRLYGQQCSLSPGNVPVMSRPDPLSSPVGTLTGGGAHWFLGQQPGEPYTHNTTHNYWWAYTRAGNGQWGWVSVLYFADPGPDQSANSLQYGCYDVRPDETDTCHPI